MTYLYRLWLLPCVCFVLATPVPAVAQNPAQPAAGMVQLNFPGEVDVKTLVDYVSQRLGLKILYDEQIASKKLSVRAPGEIPVESLQGVLQSALRMKGLALVDADEPGWKRITAVTQLQSIAIPEEAQSAIDKHGSATAVTQAFVLKHADAQKVDQTIKPFLTQPGANSIAVKEGNVLVVTDYATNVLRIAKLVELIDLPQVDAVVEFVPVQHTDASSLAQQLQTLVSARSKARGAAATAPATVEVVHDARTNQLVVLGLKPDVEAVLQIAKTLDVSLGVQTEVYQLRNVAAERVDRLVQELMSPVDAKTSYRSTIDADGNTLIVTTTPQNHTQLESIIRKLDVASPRDQSRVRFYKLKNVTVDEMLETLRGIEQGGTQPRRASTGSLRVNPGQSVPGSNMPPPPPAPVQNLPPPPAYREERPQEPAVSEAPVESGALQLGAARVSGDANTNTLIVMADPSVQQVYADLIRTLDFRRPQVLIEAKVVTLDTSDDFQLGVEISGGDRLGVKRLFAFTSYGFSKVDPVTGALSIIPGIGLNGTLVDPETADAVLRAVTNHRRGKLLSAPRILVNDNATGTLTSVAEVPFTSVNASQTVATTSFAGFAQAGTTVQVTPHISDDDHLQLEYTITLNSFTGTGSQGIPPPRQTDELASEVTIPDGYTIIVGGLNRTSDSKTLQGFPYAELIPGLRELTSNRTAGNQQNSLFVFLRPVVLRSDKFNDLKFLSERDTHKADIHGQYPKSRPLLMR